VAEECGYIDDALLNVVEKCDRVWQAEVWSVFTAMLKKSRRNLAACTDVGLIASALALLSKADDVSAGIPLIDFDLHTPP
jgi:hypothetical protein